MELYEPSLMRLAMVVGPSGRVSLARLDSDWPDAALGMAEVMGRFSIEGWVS